MEIRPQLRVQLRQLKMPGMWHALTELGHLEFLSLLIQDELFSMSVFLLIRA